MAFRFGRVGQRLLARQGLAADVVAEDVADLDAVGQRLDSRRVHLLELRHVVDDRVELAREGLQLVGADPQPGQQRDLGHVGVRQRHVRGSLDR